MNREDIIRMAEEAGFDYSGVELSWESVICTEELERFADLVASAAQAKEREACIELVAFYGGPVDLEAAIRARGDKHD